MTINQVKKIETPLSKEVIESLRAGDAVTITGEFFTGRDMAHKRLCDLIDAGSPLPIELDGAVMYFVGPTPATQGRPIGSAGPTTSSRMDAFSPKLLKAGLKGMIGKGYRDEKVIQALKDYKAIHFATIGGAGALLAKHIVSSQIVAYEDLGTEAIRKLQVVEFPAVVAYDSNGNTVYKY